MQLLPLTATVMPFTTTSIYLEDAFQAQYPAAQVRLLIFLKVLNHLFLASQGFTYPIGQFPGSQNPSETSSPRALFLSFFVLKPSALLLHQARVNSSFY